MIRTCAKCGAEYTTNFMRLSGARLAWAGPDHGWVVAEVRWVCTEVQMCDAVRKVFEAVVRERNMSL